MKRLIGWCIEYYGLGKESVAAAYNNPPFSSDCIRFTDWYGDREFGTRIHQRTSTYICFYIILWRISCL